MHYQHMNVVNILYTFSLYSVLNTILKYIEWYNVNIPYHKIGGCGLLLLSADQEHVLVTGASP